MQELPLRLELIIKFRKRLKENFAISKEPYDFTNLQIAIFLLMPVETLRYLPQDTSPIMNSLTLQRLLPFLVHGIFPDGSSIYPARVAVTSKSICQNDKEREKCLLRDQRVCALTNVTIENPCYIAPVGLTANQANMYAFTDSILINKLMGDIGVQISRTMVTDSLGAFEKSWNMLCLHPTLCKWWNFFHLLQPGDSFEILVDSQEEALKMKAALEFQWVAVRLAALSGTSKEWKWESR
ncbi:hypothetical protein T069G_08677 [Trichoderma breve]|uniref:HNH nuclease domain-containing protein n=1 Tax=Trichoderma breve TaxID=2034170 RepID=A0A9W9E570_9HYPO|nr:hypothetical protein T069G_08677 [Trichoderma breve]KAJ4857780.1 hypothetical protein T069G_08677 [Trichoderma breve]